MKREKKKILLLSISLIVIFCIFFIFLNLNETYKIKKYINSNKEELQKLINNDINLSEMKDKSLIKNIFRGCNESSCYIRFDIGASGFASNSCYKGFYYTEKDIMHKYEYYDRIIEENSLDSYKVREKTGDNILYLTRIMERWYYFKSCY